MGLSFQCLPSGGRSCHYQFNQFNETPYTSTPYRTAERRLHPMADVLQVPVCRGYLAKLCNGVISDSLSAAHEELRAAIPTQAILGSDESSLKNNGKKHWIWCITASMFTVFHIASSRGRKVLEELIGTDFAGIVNFDYFSSNCSFAWNFDVKSQYCWAHLIRDIRFLEKHPNKKARRWAGKLLDRTRRLFKAWHRRDEMSQDYFRFMFEPGAEPTNNHTEQQIRHCVIDRRITQGTRSEALPRTYVERDCDMYEAGPQLLRFPAEFDSRPPFRQARPVAIADRDPIRCNQQSHLASRPPATPGFLSS